MNTDSEGEFMAVFDRLRLVTGEKGLRELRELTRIFFIADGADLGREIFTEGNEGSRI
jgi:hypothetical protein